MSETIVTSQRTGAPMPPLGCHPGESRGPWCRLIDGPRVKHGVTTALLVTLALFLSSITPALAFSPDDLRHFAQRAGLEQTEAFAETVTTLRTAKTLPKHYVTKREAEKLGWKPGQDLCRVAPGKA